MIAYSGIIASEPLYTFLSLAALHSVLWAQSYARWGWSGFLVGLATLVRPQAILLPLAMVAAPRPTVDYKKPKPLAALILCFLIALTTITPWLVRNYRTHGHFVFISTNGGDNLWIGHNQESTGNYQPPLGIPQSPPAEIANDKLMRSAALDAIRSNPGRSISLIPAKIAATFNTPTDITYWAFQTDSTKLIVPGMNENRELFLLARQVTAIFTGALLIAMGFGFLAGLVSPSGRLLIRVAAPQILLTALVVSIFFGNGRFALPTVPFQAILAVAGLATLREWVGRHTPADPDDYGYRSEIIVSDT